MTRRHVANRKQVPRINACKDRKGYRVFARSTYLGYFTSKKKAENFIRNYGADDDRQHVEFQSEPKFYNYVRSKSTQKKTMYYGVMRVQRKIDKQWTKKYFPWCHSPKEAANMVAEYLETTSDNIKDNKVERESPEQSVEQPSGCMGNQAAAVGIHRVHQQSR